jgi:dihydrofolate reductase
VAQGLLDELSLNVVPFVRGAGIRLFDDIGTAVRLELVRSEPFDTGVIGLTYRCVR